MYIYYVSLAHGADSFDGLTPATAFKTMQKAADAAPLGYTEVRVIDSGGTVYPIGGNVMYFKIVNFIGGTLDAGGNWVAGGSVVVRTTSGYVSIFEAQDFAWVGVNNFNLGAGLDGSATPFPGVIGVHARQNSGWDQNGVIFGNMPGGVHSYCETNCYGNYLNNGVIVSGVANYHLLADKGSRCSVGGTLLIAGGLTPSSAWFGALNGSTIDISAASVILNGSTGGESGIVRQSSALYKAATMPGNGSYDTNDYGVVH